MLFFRESRVSTFLEKVFEALKKVGGRQLTTKLVHLTGGYQ